MLHWAVSFVGRGRPERVATEQQAFARRAMKHYGDPFQAVRAAEEAENLRAAGHAASGTQQAGTQQAGTPVAEKATVGK